jgi:glycosyltransferase involved in cell wall biosynthesis
VRNGLQYESFAAIPDKSEDGWIDIAIVARFAPIKDLKTLIYTFSRLKREFKKVRLHIVGGVDDEEYHQECLELIDYLKVDDIIMPGSVNIKAYLEKIDFTILTSVSEGQPFALLESMAARRPVIATDVGCCRELIEGDIDDKFGLAGICAPPMHQAKLLQALVQMCNDAAGRKAMGIAGQQRVKSYYEIGNVINHYLNVYGKAVSTWQGSVSN